MSSLPKNIVGKRKQLSWTRKSKNFKNLSKVQRDYSGRAGNLPNLQHEAFSWNKEENAAAENLWETQYYVDEFNQETDAPYIVN